MTEIPEHLLQRSKERRKALGLPVGRRRSRRRRARRRRGSCTHRGRARRGRSSPRPPSRVRPPRTSPPRAAPRSRPTCSSGPSAARPRPPAAAAAAAAGGAAAAATATLPAPTTMGPGGHTQRLLTVVKSGSIQQTRGEAQDKVHTWPHLLVIEFAAILILLAGLVIFAALVRAPLLSLADFNKTPNPSKAPWYFLGLQELLTMFNPQIAGVLAPGIALVLLMLAPFVDKNPSNKPTGPQVRHLDLHPVHGDVGGPRDHRFVLPWPGLQPGDAMEGRDLLRVVGAQVSADRHRHRRDRRCSRSSVCS